MKIMIRATLLAFALTGSVAVQAGNEHAGHMSGSMAASAKAMPMSEGLVKKVDQTAGRVTLAHGPLENLEMPAMTMAFRVKESAWLGRMKVGERIRFVAENVDGALTVTRFEPAK